MSFADCLTSCILFAAAPAEAAAEPLASAGPLGIAMALLWLSLMEIVLGIDNVIFIAILAGRLPPHQQHRARQIGLTVALVSRLLLLGLLFFLSQLDKVILFSWTSLGAPADWFAGAATRDVSVKDIVLLLGGIFLIAKSTIEIHHKLEGQEEGHAVAGHANFGSTISQIALLDIVFSLDSVITAVGMVRADPTQGIDWLAIGVMVTAMVIALGVMLLAAGFVSDFVARHPTVKMLALAFLILIGVMLVAEGTGKHIEKGYIYFAMAFSVGVELLNMRLRGRQRNLELRDERLPPEARAVP